MFIANFAYAYIRYALPCVGLDVALLLCIFTLGHYGSMHYSFRCQRAYMDGKSLDIVCGVVSIVLCVTVMSEVCYTYGFTTVSFVMTGTD